MTSTNNSAHFLIKDNPAPLAILDTELKLLNHSNELLNEHRASTDFIDGQSFFDIFPEFPKELMMVVENCLKGESNNNSGRKFILPQGKICWYRWKINPWYDDYDSVQGLIVLIENVTEEKIEEELLLKAKKVARIGGWEVDLLSSKVYWTDITREIHEVDSDYMPNLEEGISFYKEGEDRDKITFLVNEAMCNGKSWDTELRIITGKGNEVWVRAKGEAEIISGKCVRLFGTFQDIDRTKKIDLKYREVSQRLAIATSAAGVGIWEYNIPENTLIWDENMYLLYGIKRKDFKGVYEAWEKAVHPDDKSRCQKEIEMAIGGEKEFNTEFRVVWPNHDIHFIKAKSIVQRDSKGNPLKMVGINWDITSIKETEEKLKRLLKTTTDQNEGLSNFAHIVSHNLRSHSANLSMLSGYLLKSEESDDFTGSNEEKRDVTRMLGEASESLNETIMHLNEVVQIRSDIREKIKLISLSDAIDRVHKNIGKLLKENNADCQIKVNKSHKPLAVPAYLDSILLNLFTNSLKYSHPDRNPKICISASKRKNLIIVRFRDNGLGIDLSRYGKKLFGMYKTFHKHKDAKGIGLFITKNQIEAMGGRIEVESTVGEGTEFLLYFKT